MQTKNISLILTPTDGVTIETVRNPFADLLPADVVTVEAVSYLSTDSYPY